MAESLDRDSIHQRPLFPEGPDLPELGSLPAGFLERSSLLERFSELSPDGLCVLDVDCRLVQSDASFRGLLGVDAGELEGTALLHQVVPEDRPAVRRAFEAWWDGSGPREQESRWLRSDGTVVWVALRAKAAGNRIFALARDISQRKQVEMELDEARRELERWEAEGTAELRRTSEALEESEALFRAISEELPDALLLLDQESQPLGRIVHANPAACEQHGYSLEELTTLTIFDLDDDSTAEANQDRLVRLQAGETVAFEGFHHKKDGSIFPVEVVAREIYYQGRRLVLAIERDLTERKEQEARNQRLQSQVLQTQKLETLGVLAGGIAHDFNNLLVGILGNAGLALEDLPGGSGVRPFLEEIEDASERAAELCRQMLAYSGKGQFVLTDLHLDSLVREMAPLLWASISRKAELVFDLPRVPTVRADVEQMRQLVLNLISNASDALDDEPGNIRIALYTRRLRDGQLAKGVLDERLPAGNYVQLEVSDTGSGMDEVTHQRLFDPFFTTKFTGRGMGLAAV
ncbi:MAG: PAS domain S-box protein, partial [Holophagales bacterium]|nr:PAS domain S-box protein [Holophagales bacterium]